jgi:excisionase family DNA binding protein
MKEKKLDSGLPSSPELPPSHKATARQVDATSCGNDNMGDRIRQWAAENDWYKVDITTNQLRLEQAFGLTIETVTTDMDRRNQSKMRRQVFDCFDHLMAKCRQIDMVCRTGCRSEAEMLELEFLRGKAVGAAAELSEVVRIIGNLELKIENVEKNNLDSRLPPSPKGFGGTGRGNDKTEDEWITFAQAAEILGVSKPTLTRWADDGKIQCNGKKGRLRKLNKVSVLLAKQAVEDEAVRQDIRELRQDARKFR